MPMEHNTSFSFQGRYFTEGDRQKATSVWVVLHGYGQLASYFIRKFAVLQERSVYVIAPEALSHFYLEDVSTRVTSGNTRVGGSWMTRENRLTDIRNYLTYLDSVYERELKGTNLPVTVFGFSQGAATASRWVFEGRVDFQRLVLWAGVLPPDIDFSRGKEILKGKETIMVYGNDDPFINDSRFMEMNTLAEKLSVTPKIIRFDGGHDLNSDALLSLV
jgi:predicted esterase